MDEILSLPYDNLYIYPVVDAYSRDRTEEIIREKEAQNSKVKCIFYRESKGVISCYLEGFHQALLDGAEQILEMDGGGSHLPSEIPQFLQRMEEGYDCVWGSRFMDMTSGFEGFQRKVLEHMNLDAFLSTGHMYQTEMRFYCRKLRTVEVPIHYVGTASSLKSSSVMEALRLLFQLKQNEPQVMGAGNKQDGKS